MQNLIRKEISGFLVHPWIPPVLHGRIYCVVQLRIMKDYPQITFNSPPLFVSYLHLNFSSLVRTRTTTIFYCLTLVECRSNAEILPKIANDSVYDVSVPP